MNAPCISIIVPVYQTEKYLKECVDSILRQSFTDFELLLINDGSTDGSGLICDHYAQIDERVKVIHKKNAGVSAARNTGLEISRGEYIVFMDSDDTADEGFLEFAVNSLTDAHADVFLSGLKFEVWNDGRIDRTIRCGITATQNYTIRELLENMDVTYSQICICVPTCKLYKREIIQKNNLRFPEFLRYSEDTWFNLDYFSHCNSVIFSQKVFYHYRQVNTESLTARFHKDTYEVHQMVWYKMRALMQIAGCCGSAMDWFEALYFDMLLGGAHEYYRFYKKTTAKERYAHILKIARDPCISKVQMRYISSWKNRVLLALLRLKLLWAVASIFEIRYHRAG